MLDHLDAEQAKSQQYQHHQQMQRERLQAGVPDREYGLNQRKAVNQVLRFWIAWEIGGENLKRKRQRHDHGSQQEPVPRHLRVEIDALKTQHEIEQGCRAKKSGPKERHQSLRAVKSHAQPQLVHTETGKHQAAFLTAYFASQREPRRVERERDHQPSLHGDKF